MTDVIGVSALNRYVKSTLDGDAFLSDLALRGEVSGFVNHVKSGHWYFTLKDEKASVKAVMFRQEARRLGFVPQDGMRMVVRCRVSLYEATGSFQVYVQDLFPDGLGAAQLAFDQLKARLEQEGLFRPEHKKPLPAYPKHIGVVTSATGAALQDIRNVLSRRWPLATLLLAGVNVQGLGAAGEINEAIAALDSSGLADVMAALRRICGSLTTSALPGPPMPAKLPSSARWGMRSTLQFWTMWRICVLPPPAQRPSWPPLTGKPNGKRYARFCQIFMNICIPG